ncbi:MAG: signal peptidase II [Proteobacteria bacterium]|nr:signal peptidase II [Pseudomonadota bacterium]
MAPKTRVLLLWLAITLPLDQISKQWIIRVFHYGDRQALIPGLLDLTHVRNPGGAFSFFADGPLEQRLAFFIGTTVIAIGLLVVFLRQLEPENRFAAVGLGMILGGALGNLIDRIVYTEVIDFIDVHLWGGYTWPTFNFADSFIVVGVGILLVETFFESGNRAEPGEDSAAAASETPPRAS